MAKKTKVKLASARTGQIGPSIDGVNTGMIGGAVPSATTLGAQPFQGTISYKADPLLKAKLPADFESISSQVEEEKLIADKREKKLPAKKKASKKVAPKKAPKKASVKPGKITYTKSIEPMRVTAEDAPKY